LAEKHQAPAKEKAFYFPLFHVSMVFFFCKLLSVRIFQKICPSEINRAEKPTVGFLILAGSGNIIFMNIENDLFRAAQPRHSELRYYGVDFTQSRTRALTEA
jgi:hypothetical protein